MLPPTQKMGPKRSHDDVGGRSDCTNNTKRVKRTSPKQRRRVPKKTLIASNHRVKGSCLACKQPVTVKQPRFKISGFYCHLSCYCKVPTPFACRICGGSTVLGDVLIFPNKSNKKRTSLTPVACDHMKCIQRCKVANKTRLSAATAKIIESAHKKIQLLD